MARPKKRRADDPPSDPFPSKKAKSSGIRAGPSSTRRQIREDNSPKDQIPSDKGDSGGKSRGTSNPHHRKRRADSVPSDEPRRKRPKSNGTIHKPSARSSELGNNLTEVSLTPRLQEHNRRNKRLHQPKPATTPVRGSWKQIAAVLKRPPPELERLAATGGPDLRDLSGYPEPSRMSPVPSSDSRRTRSTKATSVSSRSGRSSAYDGSFARRCIDYNIYPPVYKSPDGTRQPKPANFTELRQLLKVPRGSLSPSVVPQTAFEDFQDKNATKSEGTVMRNVVPLVAGDTDILNEGHIPFTNLTSITANTTVLPVPDFFDGAHPDAVNLKVREDLDEIIVPTRKDGVPIAPNFFLEAKAPGGTIEVATRQAVLDGAYGARMMHALQNYGVDPPTYDGNAYAFSSTYLDGLLNLYAHHLSAPASPSGRPSYHTTLLKAYALHDDEVFSEGRGAFRNLRVRARDNRDRLIKIANERAHRCTRNTDREEDGAASMAAEEDSCSSPLILFECLPFARLGDRDETQEIHDTQETIVGLAIVNQAYGKDDTAGSPDVGASLASSFTSVSDEAARNSQPKLPRSPPSPSTTRPGKRSAKYQTATGTAS